MRLSQTVLLYLALCLVKTSIAAPMNDPRNDRSIHRQEEVQQDLNRYQDLHREHGSESSTGSEIVNQERSGLPRQGSWAPSDMSFKVRGALIEILTQMWEVSRTTVKERLRSLGADVIASVTLGLEDGSHPSEVNESARLLKNTWDQIQANKQQLRRNMTINARRTNTQQIYDTNHSNVEQYGHHNHFGQYQQVQHEMESDHNSVVSDPAIPEPDESWYNTARTRAGQIDK